MKKKFDSVKLMHEIRDRMSREIKDLSPAEQIAYFERQAGLRKPASADAIPSLAQVSETR